jgi:outer membrane protein TolC
MMKRVFPLILILFFSASLLAQEAPISFSLQEAVDYAVSHNQTLLNASSDIMVANKKIEETRGSIFPQVSASFDYMTNFDYEAEFEVFGNISTILMEDQSSLNIQVSQLIFSGQFWVGLEMSKIARNIAEKNKILTELDIKENVINSYYLILVTEKLTKIISENQENLTSVLKHTQDMFKAGVAEQTDVDQLHINLSQLENSKKVMERNLKLNYNMLRFVLGIENEAPIELTESIDDLLLLFDKMQMSNSQFDISTNPTYQIMETQEILGKKAVELKKWAYAPTLAGYYSYKEKLMTTGFDLSPKNAAGLTLSVPIFSGLTKNAQLSQAKIELDKINRSKSMLKEQLAIQNNQISFELNNAYENYQTQKENVEVAQRVYNSINNKFKQGMVSSLDLTQANSNYLQAENNYVSAILQLLQSKLKLDKLYNNL